MTVFSTAKPPIFHSKHPLSTLPPSILSYHTHHHSSNTECCSSLLLQPIAAPVPTVWSILRRFDEPQTYKHFIKRCHLLTPHNSTSIGAVREVEVISGMPALTSREQLETLDEENHVIGFKIVGGEHRLCNYRSATSVSDDGNGGSVVVESYVVDVPDGNTVEDTVIFVNTIVRCNLQSLKKTAEGLVVSIAGEFQPFDVRR